MRFIGLRPAGLSDLRLRLTLGACGLLSALAPLEGARAPPSRLASVLGRAGAPWLYVEPQVAGASRGVDATKAVRAREVLVGVSAIAARLGSDVTATTVDRFGGGDAIVHFEQTHH